MIKGEKYNLKTHLTNVIILLIFLLSLFNNITLLISLFLSILLLFKKDEGAIKGLFLICIRTIINPYIAVELNSFQNVKYFIILLFSLFLLRDGIIKEIKHIFYSVILFSCYIFISSFFVSSYPFISIFKLLSYSITFLALINGISKTKSTVSWLSWVNKWYFFIFFISLFTLPTKAGYFRNGISFQGILNQPNMLGIVLIIYLGILLTRIQIKEINFSFITLFQIILIIFESLLSRSRTSFASIMIMFFYFFVSTRYFNITFKTLTISLLGIIIITFNWFTNISKYMVAFFKKGNEYLLFSRNKQLSILIKNFFDNAFFGSGFGVPKSDSIHMDILNFSVVVEPGNIILAVLSYGGIIGFILFANYLIIIFLSGNRLYFLLFLSTLLLSMGEMVFFSTNSIGILLYLSIGIYISSNRKVNKFHL